MKEFCELTRFYSLPMSAAPLLIAIACALKTLIFPDFYFITNVILVFLGTALVHLGGNLLDDYLDVKYQKHEFNVLNKAKLLIEGTYSRGDIEKILFWIFTPAFLIGIYFICQAGAGILFYMITAALLCAFYPISSKYGLSEVIIGIIFGPLLINGAYLALTGFFSSMVFNFSIASGIITTILLLTHSIMDYEYDVKAGKNTIPVLLENKNLVINLVSILILFAYGILTYTMLKYHLKSFVLLPVILTLPVGIKLILSLYDYINLKDVKFQPKWYFGAMENWSGILKSGTAYFMYRIYLARNLAVIFNIALVIACLMVFKPVRQFHFFF